MTKLEQLAQQFIAGEIDKFDFYEATKNYPAQKVADAADIDIEVVKDRRRYLRQLAKQTSKTTTIQITKATAEQLDEIGDVMREIFPDIFAAAAPTKDIIVSFLIGHFMSGLTDKEIAQLRADWAARQAARN